MSENVKANPSWFNFQKIFLKSVLFFVLCCVFPFIFFSGVIGGFFPTFKSHVFGKTGLVLFIVTMIAVYLAPLIYTLPRAEILPLEKPILTKKIWKLLGLLVIFWLISIIFIAFGFRATGYKVPIPTSPDILQLMLFGFVYCLIAPLAEEMLCRGLFYADFKRYFSDYVVIPSTALLFALMHGLDPFKLMMMFLAGCVFGYARAITGGVFAPILLHIVNNIFAFTFIALSAFGILK